MADRRESRKTRETLDADPGILGVLRDSRRRIRAGSMKAAQRMDAAIGAVALIGQGAFHLISACRRHAGTKKDDTVPPTAANSDRAPMLPEYSSVR